ncbi:GC-rich sequence DNA-binding factor-like protein-domain-containing protein [Obelidium mucronatum]|nr:GC-rich sequence DNA-binding factor-like protein-domain-containing protein [Obelidium mucronatum]
MGRRKAKHFEDDYDSSDADSDNEDGLDGLDADEREEARLFQNKRPRKRFTKEDAALGIFNEADGDDFGGGKGGFRSRSSVSGGIAFVKTETVDSESSSDDDGGGGGDGSDGDNAEDKMDVDQQSNDSADEFKREPRNRQEEENDEQEANERPQMGMGLGFNNFSSNNSNNTGGGGLGFGPSSSSSSSSSRAGLGASSSKQTPATASPSTKPNPNNTSQPPPKKPAPIILDARQKQPTSNSLRLNPTPDKDFMKFDKEGKGLGFLLKMGYKKGSGLGKEGQGIVNPIDVKLRPQKMGLGHRGFDERTQTVKLEQQMKRAERGGEPDSDEDDDAVVEDKKSKSKKDVKVDVDQWKRGPGKRKGKVSYKTAEELIQDASGAAVGGVGIASQKTKIIDMTGAQARELNNMAELASGAQIAALREAASHLVELRYNVRTMASESEIDLMRLSKALALENKNLARADQEIDSMKKRVEMLGAKRVRLAQVIELAQKVVEEGKRLEKSVMLRGSGGVISSDEIDSAFSSLFQRIQTDYFDEYVEHRLDSLVVGAMAPLIKRMLLDWSPLQDPFFGLDSFRKWRKLFRFSVKSADGNRRMESSDHLRSMTPFESMMYNIWLPKVRQDLNNNWDPLNPDPCITLIEAWYPSSPTPEIIVNGGLPELANPSAPHLLPPWMHNNIINQLILPKLLSSISEWDPRASHNNDLRPHQWLFPWLPILQSQFLQKLAEPIKNKLSLHLSEFHPLLNNSTVLPLLQPWKQVLSSKTMDTLLNKSILPKLVSTLRIEFTVNPAAQDMKPLESVLEWRHLFPQPVFQHLIETEFFPKWIQVCWLWLGSPNVSFDEVSRWYLAWKGVFPEDVQEWSGVQEGWKVGLDLMNRALAGGEGEGLGTVPKLVPMAERGDVYHHQQQQQQHHGKRHGGEKEVTGKPDLVRRKEVAVGFLELVERTAVQVGLVLLPTGRSHGSGKPVYKLEKGDVGVRKGKGVLFYVDEGVVFVYNGGAVGDSEGSWGAVGVDELVGIAMK